MYLKVSSAKLRQFCLGLNVVKPRDNLHGGNTRVGIMEDFSYTQTLSIYSISQEICTQFCCALLCFVVVMQSFIMNSHEVFIHIHQGCFAGTGAIVRLPQCQWSKPDEYGKISQCITTTKHSKAKTVCIFLGIYCTTKVMLHHAS